MFAACLREQPAARAMLSKRRFCCARRTARGVVTKSKKRLIMVAPRLDKSAQGLLCGDVAAHAVDAHAQHAKPQLLEFLF